MSADGKDAAVVRQVDRTGSAAAATPGCEADSVASGCLVDEPISAVKSEPGTNSAAAAALVNEPCSFAVAPAGEASFEAAVKSFDESCSAAAPVGEPYPASGQPGLQAETGPGGEEQAEEDLKCFEWRTAHCEGS